MRGLATVLAGSLLVSGCAANTYQIPSAELARLAREPPDTRGQRVRVIQDITASDVPPAGPCCEPGVGVVVVSTPINVGGGRSTAPVGGSKIGGAGNDSKAAAIAFLVFAASAMITAAIVEGTRFDGYAQLHPNYPVHLIGKDGSYTVRPLSTIDPGTAAWTETAVVRPSEGPWLALDRAPLSRTGLAYGMYGGTGSLRSATGDLQMGPAWTVQLGYFPSQTIGVFASVFFGWRDNIYNATLFETRYTAELQALPLQLGILHGGVYGGIGAAYRFEDAVKLAGSDVVSANHGGGALTGGAMFQLDFNTRVALTVRLGTAYAHGEQMHDALIGLSVY